MAEEEKKGAPPKATPGAPRPITVRLKPVVPKKETRETADGPAKKSDSAVPKSTAGTAPPEHTARVPIPVLDDIDDKKNDEAPTSATVKLRPVKVAGGKPPLKPAGASAAPKPLKPVAPVSKSSHKPGSDPLPPGPKPPSKAQVQAAKSKTSRISLDSAIGVAPDGPMSGSATPKTIKLKRPAKLAGSGKMPSSATAPLEKQKAKARTAPLGKTSRIPDETIPKLDDPATVTQKKTLKIKKRGASAATGDAAGEADSDFEGLTPISEMDLSPVKKESAVFTTIAGIAAIAAVVVGFLLVVCLGSHAIGPNAGKNSLASVKADIEMPWPGAIPK